MYISDCPLLSLLPLLSYISTHVLTALFLGPVLAVCPGGPGSSDLPVLFCLSYLPFLFCLSCSTCAVLDVPFCFSCPDRFTYIYTHMCTSAKVLARIIRNAKYNERESTSAKNKERRSAIEWLQKGKIYGIKKSAKVQVREGSTRKRESTSAETNPAVPFWHPWKESLLATLKALSSEF